MFSLRIVTTSHYQVKPIPGLDTTYSEFRNSAVVRVPVLRIFGSTPAGQKTCMHVHGVFPYLYVPYDGTQPADRYLRQFAASLDKALNVAHRTTNSSCQHVYKISLVSGIPMYGYHPQEECFLKIYLFNPTNVRKAADLLLGGAVMNKPFQPYESHIPYALQLFIDYNLYGMNLINVAALKFRKHPKGNTSSESGKKSNEETTCKKGTAQLEISVLDSHSSVLSTSSPVERIWHEENIPSELWLPSSIERQSTCELEVDVVAADITNRQELASNIGANPGLAALWEDEKQRRRDVLEPSQLEPDSSQERVGVVPSDSEKELVKRFLDIVRQQQLFRNSQSDDSLPSQPSQPASQLESHVSRTDSLNDSENTIILASSDEDEAGNAEEKDEEHAPIVNMASIERVVSISQSFSHVSSQMSSSDTQDQSVADILAALLEESGVPPSQLASLEDQDSILNQSIILNREEEDEEEEETLLMTQIVNRDYVSDEETGFGVAESVPVDSDDIVMNTDEDDSGDEVNLLPQFDGASDKVPGSHKKSDDIQVPSTLIQTSGMIQGTGDVSQDQISDTSTVSRSDITWRTGTAGRVMGNSQNFPGGNGSWAQQGWTQQSSPGGLWPGQSPTWSQQYQNWPQQVPPSAFPSQQASFHPPSPAASFQSPPHNPYASPTHQQTYQTSSPSASQYQYPPYQSPTSSQTYQQQPYQSPSQLPYQSPGSGQTFHSPQSYHSSSSSNQPYQSPTTTSQPYSPLGGVTSKPYPLPASKKAYVSPPGSQPYQSSQGNSGYQSTSGQMYSSPYQSPTSHHSSPQQMYPPPYQSPVHGGHYPPPSSWCPQGYPGYFQGTGSSRKNSSGPAHPDTSFRQPGHSSSFGPDGFLSQDIQQQPDVNISNKPPGESQGSQSTDILQPQKRKGGRKKKDSSKLAGFKSPQPPCLSPTSVVVSKSSYELGQQNLPLSSPQSSNINSSLVSGHNLSHSFSQDHTNSPFASAEDIRKSTVVSGSMSSESAPVTKISTLQFTPHSGAPVSTAAPPPTSKSALAVSTDVPSSMATETVDTPTTSTPMIQQLLMEEPARMNIRKEDRDAVMKKPITNPTPPKPRKKYTRKANLGARKPGRPRSMSLSSPAPPEVGYYGYPQTMMSTAMAGQQEKSHAAPLSFSPESRMPSLMQNYTWQQQCKQQNFPQGSQWQQQHQQQWGLNEWQVYNNPGEGRSSGETGSSYGSMTSRLQQRSLSADTVQSPIYQKSSQLDQIPPFPDSHIGNSANSDEAIISRDNAANDKSSLSSLFQLVSDVGSEEIDWESESSTVVPNLFSSTHSHSEMPKATPTSDAIQRSPLTTEFITLETPYKQGFEQTNSDTADITSSGESDHMEYDPSCDLKPRTLSKSHSLGGSHPQLGKQSRLKKLGLSHTQSTDTGSLRGPVQSNPAYTYTFHVPTQVFKKLKFFRSVESRKHDIKVVRMHPMDARRYSLLKIGREIVKATKLTEADLAAHNVFLPSPYPFVSADGSTNRVNLDIPVVSVDRRSGDSGSEESSLSKFDTDFPPNKVAPPSFFHASQVSASLARAASVGTRGSPVGSDWMRQYTGLQSVNYNGRFSSGSQQGTFSPHQSGFSPQQGNLPTSQQQADGNLNTISGHPQMPQSNLNKHIGSQPSEDTSGLTFQQFSQKGSSFHPQSAPSSTHLQGSFYPNQQSAYMNHIPYPQQQQQQQPYYQQQYFHHHPQYQPQQTFQQEQPQTSYDSSNPEPKNGLRSPGQHGLMSKIESGRVHGRSGDQETDPDINATETSSFNARVSAHYQDNHAESMADQTVAQHAGLCNILHSPAHESSQSPNDSSSNDDKPCLSLQMKQPNNLNSFDGNNHVCTRPAKLLSLKRPGRCHCHSPQDVENDSHTSETAHGDHRRVIIKRVEDRGALESCVNNTPSKPAQFTTLKYSDMNTSVSAVNTHTGALESCVNNAQSKLAQFTTTLKYSDMNTSVSEVNTHTGALESCVNNAQSKLAQFTTTLKYSDMNTSVSAVNTHRGELESCVNNAQSKLVQLNTLKCSDSNTLFTVVNARGNDKTNCKKNVKSLRLKIPIPRSNQKLEDLEKAHIPFDCTEREDVTSSQRESDIDDNVTGSRNVSPCRRSTRSTSLEEDVKSACGDRQSPRQAKLRSLYSKNLCDLKPKKKRKKRQVPLVEGVHYIVTGKFRGHRAMLVRLINLNLSTTDSVSASLFEKIAAKEIVRIVPPVEYLDEIVCSAQSESLDYHSSTAEDESDSETKTELFEFDNCKFGMQAASRSKPCYRASRGRPLRHAKFKSVLTSRIKRHESVDTTLANPLENEMESKNELTGPISGGREHSHPTDGASENIKHCPYLVYDRFFFKFKEKFLEHSKAKKMTEDRNTENHESRFFEGVRQSIFHSFRQKFLENVQKLKNNDYSSSSDDEDDILDATIFSEKFGIPHMLVVWGARSRWTSNKTMKSGHDTTESDLWMNQSTLNGQDGTLLQFYADRRIRCDSLNAHEDIKENHCLLTRECGSSATKDTQASSDDDKTLSPDIVNVDQTHKCQEPTEVWKEEQSGSETNVMECEETAMQKVNNTVLTLKTQTEEGGREKVSSFDSISTYSAIHLNSGKDIEEKEDYLKSQMAFFEDITSDSDSYDTVLMDSFVGKESVSEGGHSSFTSLLPYPNSRLDELITSTAVGEVPSEESTPGDDLILSTAVGEVPSEESTPGDDLILSTAVGVVPEESTSGDDLITSTAVGEVQSEESTPGDDLILSTAVGEVPSEESTPGDDLIVSTAVEEVQSEESPPGSESKYAALRIIQASNDLMEHTEAPSSDLRFDALDPPAYSNSDQQKTQNDMDGNVQKVFSQILAGSTTQQSDGVVLELSGENNENVLNIADQNKDALSQSDEATIELDMSLDLISKDSNKSGLEQLHSSKTSDPSGSKLTDKSVDSDNELDTIISSHTSRRQKKHGKGMKKSKRDKGSQLVNRRQLMDGDNSSSNDEASATPESYAFSQNKCLRQRKQTLYTYDIMNSTEDDSSDSSDEDFSSRGSQRKGSKSKRKQKGVGLKDRQVRKLHQVNVDAGKAATGQRSRPSRGKKKKTPAGDKLLNSLSLLHMATLANLTEVQSDPLGGGQSVPVTAIRTENQHGVQYSDMANNDYDTNFTPSLEHLSFISPQNSGELAVSPPVVCSPTDKKRWKQPRGGHHRGEDLSISRRLVNSQRLANLRPGCNGASNLGSKPLPFSRLMNNSASPIPSNFSFNHISDGSIQPEPTRQYDDVGTSNTLQLLETRRAQVNCASFSMKDILRLTTPDDSMDSDSKDSAALIRPPEPRRAQVKSTTLSMSDILKLTCTDKTADTEATQTSRAVFSLISEPDPCNTQSPHKHNLQLTDFQVSPPSSEQSLDKIDSTCKWPQDTDAFNSGSQTQGKTTEKSNAHTLLTTNISSIPSHHPAETSEASQSLLSQLATFNQPVTDNPGRCNQLSQIDKKDCSRTCTASSPNSQIVTSDVTVHETMEKKAHMVKSDSLLDRDLVNSNDDSGTDDTDGEMSKSSGKTTDTLNEMKTFSTCADLSDHSTCQQAAPDQPTPSLLKAHASLGVQLTSEQMSPSSVQVPSCVVLEAPTCRSVSPDNSSPLVLETESVLEDAQKQSNTAESKLVNDTNKLASTTTVAVPQSSGTDELSADSTERLNKHQCTGPQTHVPGSPAQSVLEIPRISVTCDETTVECSQLEPQPGKPIRENNTNEDIKNIERELKPLHPLQIPPYSFIGHGFSSPSSQAFHSTLNPSLYYPYCWQWPFHTPGSDPAVSPLNLCTIQKSPNNYSPITPTSPISPNYPIKAQGVSASSMSPPFKKTKPLWYPWLTVDSARNRSEPKVNTASLRHHNRTDNKIKNNNLRALNATYDNDSNIERSRTLPATSENVSRESWIKKRDAKINSEVKKKCSSRIADLSSSPQKTSSVKVNSDKLSNCQTVSQFLGAVIETAYEQGNSSISAGYTDSITVTNFKTSTPKASNRVYSKESSTVRKNNIQHCVPSDVYWTGETAGASFGSTKNDSQSHRQLPSAVNVEKLVQPYSKDTSRAVLCHSEHEWGKVSDQKLGDRFGSLAASSLSPNRVGLKDRLITKLIKGEGFEYHHHHEPRQASGGQKRPNSSKKRSSKALNTNQNSKEQPPQKPDREKKIDKDGDNHSNSKERKLDTSLVFESSHGLTLRPVQLAPTWSSVEESMHILGLNSVQPPAAFCSSLDDLPDRPVEHGGRVLKVESKRLCELSAFTTSQHIIGINIWCNQSMSSSTLLTSQSQGMPLWGRIEQEPQLRFLLTGEKLVVVSPVCTPPSCASVATWLQNKMTDLRQAKSVQPLPLKAIDNEICTIDNTNNKDDIQERHRNENRGVSNHSDLTSADICKQDEQQKLDSSLTGSSQTFASEGDGSTLVDTDLDMSCTPTATPSLLISSSLPLRGPPSTVSQESQMISPILVSRSRRKRKLRFVDDSGREMPEVVSPTDSPTLDEHFRKTKKRNVGMEIEGIKPEASEYTSTAASSTPMKHSFEGLLDLSCTPISSQLDQSKLSSPVIDEETSGGGPDTANSHVTLLRHVSTNTSNIFRKMILTSQTQRQNSAFGLDDVSQIEGPTPKNSFGFKIVQTHMQDSKALHKYQHVTVLSLELHIETRGDLRPDPEFDAVHAVFYSVLNDIPPEKGKRSITGVVLVDADSWTKEAERNTQAEILAETCGTDPLNLPSTSHCAAFRDSSAVSDPLPSDSSSLSASKPTPNSSSQADSSSNRKPTSSPKPLASQHLPSTSAKGDDGPTSLPAASGTSVLLEKCAVEGLEVAYVKDEMDLINTITQLVIQIDPDILVGFEIQMLSWGYLLQRAAFLNVDLCSKISRVQDAKNENRFSSEKDEWGADHMSEIHVAGRIVLNLWRILRHEVTLNVYSFENTAYHVLHQRVPLYSFRSLSKWYSHKTHLHRWRVFEHYLMRVKGQLEIMDKLDLIGKTSEFARVFGLEFYDVLARGSQIRVESMMLRLAKPMNFVPVSPGVNQRARQRAAECIQLNLEPESKYYTSPVAVLDFQSLYPSIMIAYNYCFTTCLGRLDFLEKAHEGPIEFGCASLNLTPATLKNIREHVTVSPNGVAFLKSSVRRGVLPIMVEEILNTRLMVKKSMKKYKDDKILSRMLDARQLGLKLIANVTYGYTGASFSGRMPCIEVGDSIVRKARESLERAIALVRATPRWGAHVVYGDTDSMFIHLPGRSKDEAFVLGQEIADAVTAMFPSPIKLRFEKVYLPCVLQTKKRYVGFMYETPDQKDPVYDAKGIETVRRDACSAVSKILERSIKVLFTTHDLSRVRAYVTRQLHKLLEGKVSIIDLIFAKEYRGIMGYKPGACVPALEIARRRLKLDRRSEPRVGERVPYVIVHGSPGLPLIQLVKEPSELVADLSLRLNASYYITKQILPPLNRIFSLIGVSVFKWYLDMPKVVRVGPMIGAPPTNKQGTISQFFATNNCPVCDAQTKQLVCQQCRTDPQLVVFMLTTKIRDWEKTYCRLAQVCDTCQGTQDSEQMCVSIDCPIMFRRIIARQDLVRADNLQEVLTKYLQF